MIIGQKGFNLGNAFQCAVACQLVYQRADIATEDAHANVIDCADGSVMVAIRGTKSIRDILTDVSAWRESIEGCDVHKGFYTSATGIRGLITQTIDGLQNRWLGSRRPIFVTGHSLGGAQAVIIAYQLRCLGYQVANVYTFGQPRTGNRAWAAKYDATMGPITYRVTNGADIVPWVPWLLGSYYHSSVEEYMPFIGARMVENPTTARKLAINGVELYREWKRKELAALDDHHIERYLQSLGMLCSQPVTQYPEPIKI